jgi:hypothetical protein
VLHTCSIMGKRMRVPFAGTAEQVEEMRRGRRNWLAKKRRDFKRARNAVDALATGLSSATAANAIDKIGTALGNEDSSDRLSVTLALLTGAPGNIFCKVFLEWWNRCDATWHDRDYLLDLLRHHRADLAARLPDLPPRAAIYRGCSAERVRGVSWTPSEPVAQEFARGHRMIRVPNPVVARAEIDRVNVFAVINVRDEDEVILDPDWLQNLTVVPFIPIPA